MNQSDIRGLAFQPEPTVIFFVASVAFYRHEFSLSETNLSYRNVASRFVVPTRLSIVTPESLVSNLNFNLSTQIPGFGWGVFEKNENSSPEAIPFSFFARSFFAKNHAASFLSFRACHCVIIAQIKPANSLATAIFALQGIFPLLSKCRCR
jgi:hypothetical protein